jgi:hypothetical protein
MDVSPYDDGGMFGFTALPLKSNLFEAARAE